MKNFVEEKHSTVFYPCRLSRTPTDLAYSPPPSPSPAPSTSTQGASSTPTREKATAVLHDAPPGPRQWPLLYAADMARGFALVEQQVAQRISRQSAFVEVFGYRYVRQTYTDNIRLWDAAARVEGEQERWISKGRTEEGMWVEFRKVWRK